MSSEQGGTRLDGGVSNRESEGAALVSSFYARIGIVGPSRHDVDYSGLRERVATEQLEKWGFTR